MTYSRDDIESILLSEEDIARAVDTIAAKISEDYRGKNLMLLCILKGSVVFFTDLMRRLTVPVQLEFMRVRSYGGGTTSSGAVNILLDADSKDVLGADVLIIEDIVDSGRTLSYLTKYLMQKGASSVRTCTLLDKPDRRRVELVPDYTGAVIPDVFVVGYGLDYAEKYRALPFVGILKREIYEKQNSLGQL